MTIPKGILQVWGKNKYQIYPSIAASVVGATYYLGRPLGYETSLIAAGGFVIGFMCALNAFLDAERMNCLERTFSTVWFILLLMITPLIILDIVSPPQFFIRY